MQADAVDGRDPDGAGNDVLDFLKLAVQGVIILDDLLAEFIKDLAFTRQAELLFAAFDQQRFELPFQRTDLLADSGLSNVVDLRGLGETLGFGQVAEDLEAFDLHKLRLLNPKLTRQSTGMASPGARACLTLRSNSWLVNGFCR